MGHLFKLLTLNKIDSVKSTGTGLFLGLVFGQVPSQPALVQPRCLGPYYLMLAAAKQIQIMYLSARKCVQPLE